MWIHVIGDRDTVMGFKLVGVPGTVVKTKDQALQAFNSYLMKEELGILVITEKIYEDFFDYIYNIKIKKRIPLIIEIPDRKGPNEALSIENVLKKTLGYRI